MHSFPAPRRIPFRYGLPFSGVDDRFDPHGSVPLKVRTLYSSPDAYSSTGDEALYVGVPVNIDAGKRLGASDDSSIASRSSCGRQRQYDRMPSSLEKMSAIVRRGKKAARTTSAGRLERGGSDADQAARRPGMTRLITTPTTRPTTEGTTQSSPCEASGMEAKKSASPGTLKPA